MSSLSPTDPLLGRRRKLPFSRVTHLLHQAAAEPQPRRGLFELPQLEVQPDPELRTLWTFMRPNGRPSYNQELLEDFHAWQAGIRTSFASGDEFQYLVLGSRFPGVFSLGGDLNYFSGCIRRRDRDALLAYGLSCVRILYHNMRALDLPIITIGLAQGDALGGGFESLLSFDVIVAERNAKFGMPENLFNLFPGMGATSILSRKLGPVRAAEMMLEGQIFTAEQMHALGIVHILAEPGEGIEAVRRYIARTARRHKAHRAVYESFRMVNPVPLRELERIVALWADAALELREQDLRVMERLVSVQDRLRGILPKAG